MNAHIQPLIPAPADVVTLAERPPSRLREHVDLLLDNRWKIARFTAVALLLGAAYAMFGPRVYEANVLIQVEDPERSGGTLVGDSASSALNAKTPTAGEAEILKSRLVLGQAIENTKLYIEAEPLYVPVVGPWLARRAKALSEPGFLGMSGYVSGNERITVAQFDVPAELEGTRFRLNALADGAYTLSHPKLDQPLAGRVGTPLEAETPLGPVNLLVASFSARPGAAFKLVRESKQLTLLELQKDMRVVEKGKQSSVMDVSWRSGNPAQLTNLLNEVARLYVRVNIDQKTAQAQRALNFLGTELPKLKQQLEDSEEVYNRYRNQHGTISLDDEARNALAQNVDLQARLLDATQKRHELTERFTFRDPSVVTIDTQIATLKRALGTVEGRIRRMPMLQQDSLRMQRDIKVNTELYVSLLNSSLQMRLAKEGRIGNVRVLDQALLPEKPIRPKAVITMGLALLGGLFLGAASTFLRRSWRTTIASPAEIESHTGLDVYSTVPLSALQRKLDRDVRHGRPGVHVLAAQHPDDPALEGLRRLRTALKFAVPRAPNNRIMISSATPGAGKTFVSSNLAVVLASTGRRVLLIDADLRRSSLAPRFGLKRKGGLSELIEGTLDIDSATHKNVLPHLDVMTTGALPADPSGLLTSDAFSRVLEKVSGSYEVVIIDTPPALLASEAAEMATCMGTLLMVARAGDNELGDLTESAKQLRHAGAHFQGVVLNALDTRRRYYGSLAYRYGGYRLRAHEYPGLPPELPRPAATGAAT
ncbi:tyrosine-protein kinase Etk/Wzc [Variovorax sp. TBS-050B]|jgi:tyrosine-protein kinase Etk/Wzc|uniref:polysaccharide biosynthesis tyrosine autokinase n=1 Tax=Variovorax sp. TBS-050B TaxID=2940551 RepID=UPI0024771CCD|nr:polysaccharide biosynthesis tyrosine autokinase [Variovorax sp. TBS-050B]MDH6594037.1 tyrosine-protein kinase Etk/Wzc [Variovorax sp. TBS-050B]